MTTNHGMLQSSLSLPGLRRGKVRDVYDLPPDRLLIVATDRISAFDVVMPTPIAGKGRLLTDLSTFWLGFVESRGICKTHLLSTDLAALPASSFGAGGSTAEELRGRITIARRAGVVPIECVVRGYLEGSGWKEYQATGKVCGVPLPRGLRQCDRLPEPIFTPATKEELGAHDQNITFDQAAAIAGRETMEWLRATSLRIYEAAAEHARARGVIIADTKFEFGWIESGGGRELILVDEVLTPDSSRFWPLDEYEPGHAQKSFDKQFLREWLESLVAKGQWNKQAPGPSLPAEIAEATLTKYREATKLLKGV